MFKRDAKSRIYSIGMRLQCMDGLCMLPGIDLNIYYICVGQLAAYLVDGEYHHIVINTIYIFNRK